MFALPDIVRLNEEAARIAKVGPQGECEGCCDRPADRLFEYYDPYSPDPKFVQLCDRCDDTWYENGGYFYCERCDKCYIENYTWEPFITISNGELLCLPCRADLFFADEAAWLTTEAEVEQLTFAGLRSLPHVDAAGPGIVLPSGILRVEDCGSTADSLSGGLVTGFTSSSTHDALVKDLQNELRRALIDHQAVTVAIGAIYQFAVWFQVYAKEK